ILRGDPPAGYRRTSKSLSVLLAAEQPAPLRLPHQQRDRDPIDPSSAQIFFWRLRIPGEWHLASAFSVQQSIRRRIPAAGVQTSRLSLAFKRGCMPGRKTPGPPDFDPHRVGCTARNGAGTRQDKEQRTFNLLANRVCDPLKIIS